MDNRIKILDEIAKDAEKDASDFDGQPFTGKTVGTYLGYHGASIAALANILKSFIEEKELSKPQP